MEYAPILLLAYNRPRHMAETLRSLAANELAAESRLFVYSDAPRTAADAAAVDTVRRQLAEVTGFLHVTVVERSENMGLARNVIDGVTTLTERYGRVIVVEDDLVLAPHFLRFMNDALETYKDEPRVGHIQACDFTQDASLPDTFLIRWTGSWGWATWQRAWKMFNPDGRDLLRQLEERRLCREFDFGGKYGYTRMLRRQIAGLNDSWAIRWNATLFLAGVLSLNVGRSLVRNAGFDGSGTNCGGGGLYDSLLYPDVLPVEKISPIKENTEARRAYERYYGRTNSFWAKAKRRIKRTLHGDFGA